MTKLMKNITIEKNIKEIYKKIIVLTVVYVLKKTGYENKKEIDIFKINCLNNMACVTWIHRIRNEIMR